MANQLTLRQAVAEVPGATWVDESGANWSASDILNGWPAAQLDQPVVWGEASLGQPELRALGHSGQPENVVLTMLPPVGGDYPSAPPVAPDE